MARPQRNNVDYFPFDCSEGKKMYYLEETYGNDGFAVFMKLLRELARTDYHYLDLSKKTTLMFLSAKCKVSTTTLEAIINDLVELEKFDVQLWSENKIIWCQDFIDSIQDAYSKRLNNCIDKKGLLELLISLGIRKPPKSNPKPLKQPSEGGINPQSKVKKSKVEDSKENTIPPKEEYKYTLEREVLNEVRNLFDIKYRDTEPKRKKWLDEVRKLIQIDNEQPKDIIEVIKFARSDDFWKTNLLSIGGIRKKNGSGVPKYDQIKAKMNTSVENKDPYANWGKKN